MNSLEKRTIFTIGALFSFRMLGLFMILPIFSPFAQHLPDATATRIGLALGIYGLTQALFQLPFGALSDRYSRKKIIALGFSIFILGSVVAAFSHHLLGIIIGRALQGAGAVGSTLIALLSDLIHEQKRSKAMAFLGIMIGCAFFLAMLLGPLFNHWIGVRGIFALTAGLGTLAIILLYSVVPTPKITTCSSPSFNWMNTREKLKLCTNLWHLDFGIFCLHFILTALFIVVPLQLQTFIPIAKSWQVYVPAMSIAIIFTFVFIGWAESKKQVISLYKIAIFGLALSIIALALFHYSLMALGIGLTLFFTAFNLLEANLPSLISRLAPPALKGTAIGIYSTCQYSGIFLGGWCGGWLYGHTKPATVIIACAIIAVLWWVVTLIVPLKLIQQSSNVNIR